jgi:hypothetical protein
MSGIGHAPAPTPPAPAPKVPPYVGHPDGPFAGIVAWVEAELAKIRAEIKPAAPPAPAPTPPAPKPAPAPAAATKAD